MQGARRCLGGCAHGHDYVWFHLECLLLLATLLTHGPCALLELCTDDFLVYSGPTGVFYICIFFCFKIPLALLLRLFAFAFVFIV